MSTFEDLEYLRENCGSCQGVHFQEGAKAKDWLDQLLFVVLMCVCVCVSRCVSVCVSVSVCACLSASSRQSSLVHEVRRRLWAVTGSSTSSGSC